MIYELIISLYNKDIHVFNKGLMKFRSYCKIQQLLNKKIILFHYDYVFIIGGLK
jgi:hypothetical protein